MKFWFPRFSNKKRDVLVRGAVREVIFARRINLSKLTSDASDVSGKTIQSFAFAQDFPSVSFVPSFLQDQSSLDLWVVYTEKKLEFEGGEAISKIDFTAWTIVLAEFPSHEILVNYS